MILEDGQQLTIRKRPLPVVHYPELFERNRYIGDLFGFFHPDSNEYNVIDHTRITELEGERQRLGFVTMDLPKGDIATELIGIWEGDQITFQHNGRICRKRPYNLLLDIFSRNSGILETGVMLGKSLLISGAGSVGSLVSLELARAGAGKFLLVDHDTLAYHNICRHQCGVRDVGRYKVHAVADKIRSINPYVQVGTSTTLLEEVPKSLLDEFVDHNTLIVGCADNREGDKYANWLSTYYQIPFVSIGFWERAAAGEVFYSIPGKTPCYECAFGALMTQSENPGTGNRRLYTFEEDLSRTVFAPGISTDICYITTVAIKIILDLLNRDSCDYSPRVLDHLTQYTLICNTNNPAVGGERAEIFAHPLQITTSIRVDYSDSCTACAWSRKERHGANR